MLLVNASEHRMQEELRGGTHQALVVVTEAREQAVRRVEEGLTDQLEPLPSRTSPVQSCAGKINILVTFVFSIKCLRQKCQKAIRSHINPAFTFLVLKHDLKVLTPVGH